MSRPIDEKIVAMKMDNSDFVKKAAETTGIFGKLNNALNKLPGVNLGKTANELGDIRNQARRIDFDILTDSARIVGNRLSVMGMIGVTALQNITDRAMNAGIALAKNLSVGQITDGFEEYE